MTLRIYGSLAMQNQAAIQLFDAANGYSVQLKAPASLNTDSTFSLPAALGQNDQVLTTDANGQFSFAHLADTNIASNAAIALSKLAAVTVGRVIVSDQSGAVSASGITATELNSLSGVTSNVQAQIDAEKTKREEDDATTLASAKTYADNKVAALVNSAPEVLDTLKELADALNDDPNFATTIAGQIGSEATARADADSLEAAARQAADSQLSSDLSAETAARQAADSQEAQDRADAVSTEASARASGDQAVQANLDQEVSDRQAAVLSEAQARADADATLQGNIDAEAGTRGTADSALSGRIAVLEADPVTKSYVDTWGGDEANTRQNADDALSGRLDTVEGTGEGSIKKAVADLVASAPAVLDTLKELADALGSDPNFATSVAGQIGAETQARQDGDSSLHDEIVNETSRATGVESGLQTAIDAEASARVQAVSQEASARQGADSALSGRLDTLEGADTVTGSVAKAEKDAKAYADALVSSHKATADWLGGTSVTLAHNWNTKDVLVQVYDSSNGQTILTDVSRDANSVTCTSVSAASMWRVIAFNLGPASSSSPGSGGTETLLIDSPNVTQGGGVWRSSDLPWGQYARLFGITMPASGTLSKISLEARTYQGMVGNGTLSLAIKDAVAGSVLATSNGVDVTTLSPGAYAFVDFVFASPSVSLMAGQTYAIEAVFSGTQASVEITRNGSSPYFPGHSYREINTGETQVGYDGYATNAKVYTV